ncbi:MAG: ABC transporter ATP-binding protein [Shewanella sp.]
MTAQIVQLQKITKEFIDGSVSHKVLDQLDLLLNQGDTIALTGASGSGKSTLLNLIAGFERLSAGSLSLLGNDTNTWSDNQWSHFRQVSLGVIFQQFNLLTPLNVEDNIAFPLRLNGLDWNTWCDHLVGSLDLRPLLKRHVESLSGGQQQRVAIARALAHKPRLLLADEPTGNLDQIASLEVMKLLCELAAEQDTCIIMVTHSKECAEFMQRCWHLNNGKIYE